MTEWIEDFASLREALGRLCEALGGLPEETVFDSRLVANELLSNALRYGGGRARLCYGFGGGEVHISVKSANGFRPPEKTSLSAPLSERGRGLFLVDELVSSRLYDEEEGICVILRFREK